MSRIDKGIDAPRLFGMVLNVDEKTLCTETAIENDCIFITIFIATPTPSLQRVASIARLQRGHKGGSDGRHKPGKGNEELESSPRMRADSVNKGGVIAYFDAGHHGLL